ncbi:MAG: MFS transporter [Halanaerobiales bacterium]|nr:MFS transporter [Halanaerobiales bacterium]
MDKDIYYKKNYIYLILEGILVDVGFIFFDPTTILPLLMEKLTGSTFLVGALSMVRYLGSGFFSLISGNYNRTLKFKKKFLIVLSTISRLPIWILGLYLIFFKQENELIVGLFILIIQFLFWSGDGGLSTAWVDVIGKSINPYQRGRFFSARQIISGCIAIFASFIIKWLLALQTVDFPINYGIIIMIGGFLYTTSIFFFFGIKEQPSQIREKDKMIDLIKNIKYYFENNNAFTRSMVVLGFSMLSTISLPFYIIYAKNVFYIEDNTVGILIIIQTVGKIIGGLLYGIIGDKYGHYISARIYSICTFMIPLIAIFTGLFLGKYILITYSLLFFILGFFANGWPIFFNYMIDTVKEEERSFYTGLINVVKIPTSIAPFIGGIIVNFAGYMPMFFIALLLSSIAVFFAFRLPNSNRLMT